MQDAIAARILGSLSASHDADAKLDDWLYVPEPARAGARMCVYSDGYPARVRDALAETYPAVAHFVGEESFEALAHRYAASVPLASYNLNDAGAQMSEFLRRDAPTADRPFLADLAVLEWHVVRAFHAAEGPVLDPRALPWTVEDWASAVLRFQPSVAVVSSGWPLLDLWTARDTPRTAIDLESPGANHDIVVRRAGLIVRCESVPPGEALALRLLLDGRSLGKSMERLESEGHSPDTVLEWFSRWMTAGMIADARSSSGAV